MAVKIRAEQTEDEPAIFNLTTIAFETKAFSDGTEAQVIDDLRKEGDLTLSLVAIDGEQVVGHAAFSPVTIDGIEEGWFGLGPVSVDPAFQKTGIGTKIINAGLSILRSQGASGCILVGDPNYYGRFGFRSDGKLHYAGHEDRHVQWLSLGEASAEGHVKFSVAFER